MIKGMIRNIALFAVLAVVFSALTGCTDSGSAGSATNGANIAGPKKSEYPPLVEKAAQADMRHMDGSTSKVADRKGKVLLLNLWATWCGPCREEMPELVKMQDQYREQGFEIIGLNTDDGDTPEMVDKFSKEMNLNYTLVFASTEMQDALLKVSKYGGIPQSFLVDREGNLRGVFRGASPTEINKMKNTVAKVMKGEDTGAVEMPSSNSADGTNVNAVLKPVDEKEPADAKK
ncbi:MAG: TlpA disulfide reductase family protein [Pyrinomonadaceae bacterium]|nr:TlpA disulfide reductase family protein [Pyrinomonadaceae bacterium]